METLSMVEVGEGVTVDVGVVKVPIIIVGITSLGGRFRK